MANIISLQNNPLIYHAPISNERSEFRKQARMNTFFKLNIKKFLKKDCKDFSLEYQKKQDLIFTAQ